MPIFTASKVAMPSKEDFTKDHCFMVLEEITKKFLSLLIEMPQLIDLTNTIVLPMVVH